MSVTFEGFLVLSEVEVCVAQLAVDGTQGFQVFRALFDGGLEAVDTGPVLTLLAVVLPLQGQLQARARYVHDTNYVCISYVNSMPY